MSIEVLETMADECIVAGKSAKLLSKATEKATAARHQRNSERIAGTLMSMTAATGHTPHSHHAYHHPPQQRQGLVMAGGGSGGGGGASSSDAPLGIGPAMTPAESDHGGSAGPSSGGGAAHHHQGHHDDGHGTPGASGWPDPTMGINWMHAWAPVNLMDSDMIDFELGMPFMGFDTGDVPRPG